MCRKKKNMFENHEIFSPRIYNYMKLVVDNIQLPVFVINRKHRILFQNKLAKQLFNSKEGGFCWNEFWEGETLPSDQRELFRKGILTPHMSCSFCKAIEALDRGEILNESVYLRGKWWEAWWIPVSSHLFVHYFIDITELKKEEERYKNSQEFLRRMSDLIVDLVWAKDKNLRFTFANKTAAEVLLDVDDPEKALGKTLDYFVGLIKKRHPEENYYTIYEECNRTDRIVFETKQTERFEVSGFVRGKKIWLDVIKIPWFGKKGELVGLIGTARDITKRKEIEEKLRKTQEELQRSLEYHKALFESNSTLILVVDDRRKIIDANPALLRFLGYEKKELIGKDTRIIYFDDEHYNNFLPLYERFLKEGRSTVFEYSFKRKDGSVLWVEVSSSTVKLPDGKVITIWSGVDTTRIHDLKEKIKYQAIYDSLTGLHNRYVLEDELVRSVERAKRNKTTLAVCFIDLDNFKPINDRYGHDVGDFVLRTIAERLRSTVRKTDFISRFGGDEFVLILENIKTEECLDKILKKVERAITSPIYIGEGRYVEVGVSMGICLYPKTKVVNPEELLRNSDIAMYEAKRLKGNRDRYYKFYEEIVSNRLL